MQTETVVVGRHFVVVGSVMLLAACGRPESPEETAVTEDAVTTGAHVLQLKANGAFATFGHTDSTGCISTGAFIIANESTTRTVPSPSMTGSELNIVMAQSDICQHTTLLAGAGTLVNPTLTVARDLRSA